MARVDPVRIGVRFSATALWIAVRSLTVRVVIPPFEVPASSVTVVFVFLSALVWSVVTPFDTLGTDPEAAPGRSSLLFGCPDWSA